MTLSWINPLALTGLAAAVLPVIIHLLRRQRAMRVPFPTLRFLTDSRAAAVRLRSPSDPLLLLLVRVATVVAAVVAAAQPQLLTSWRRAAYDSRTSRAIVVDNSQSMSKLTRQRDEAAALERRGSAAVVDVSATRVGASLCAASLALLDGPVARHEIVVVSDFRHGTIGDADIACVPPDIGLRFVRVAEDRVETTRATLVGLPENGSSVQQRAEFDGPRTRITMELGPRAKSQLPAVLAGASDGEAVARLLRSVSRAGAPAMAANRPIAALYPSGPRPAVTPLREPWMLATLVALRESETLRQAAAVHRPGGPTNWPSEWTWVVRGSDGAPLVRAAADGNRLVVAVSAAPMDLLSVVAVRSAMAASSAMPDWNELEVESLPGSQLKAWTRAAASIPPERFKPAAPGDARWLWALALVLLTAEWALRRERAQAVRSEARAA